MVRQRRPMLVSPKLLDKLKDLQKKKMMKTGENISLWEITDKIPTLSSFEIVEKQFLNDLDKLANIDIKLRFDNRGEF